MIWGVFQPYVMKEYGWSSATAAMAFTMTTAFLAVGVLIGGSLQDRMSPRRVAMGGVFLAAFGLYATSFTSPDHPMFMYVTYGVINGIGGGSAITSSITSAQKWFADRRGFAVGVLASSTGITGIVMTPTCRALLAGIGVAATFRVLAVGVLLVGTSSALAISNPPAGWAAGGACAVSRKVVPQRRDHSTLEMLRTPQFYVLVVTIFFATPAFVLMNPVVMTLSTERGLAEPAAAAGVMLVTLSNALGRVSAPVVSDKVGRMAVVAVLLAASSSAVFSLVQVRSYGVIAAACVVAFAHGGAQSILPAISSDLFGLKHAGQNYGFVFLGSGVSAILAQAISTHSASTSGSTTVPFLVAGCSVAAAFALTVTLGRRILR